MEATIENLTAIILDELKVMNHNVGNSDIEDGDEYATNCQYFEKDGWHVELNYSLCGKWSFSNGDYWTPAYDDLVDVWGTVDEITVVYVDPVTEEETEFSEEELKEIHSIILETIKEIIL